MILTLCGLKTRRLFKTRLKRIVNYPPRRSRQLPVRQILQLRLLLIFFAAFVSPSIFNVKRSMIYHCLFTQAAAIPRRDKSGVSP